MEDRKTEHRMKPSKKTNYQQQQKRTMVITRLYSPLFLEKLFRKGLEMFSVCRYLMRKLLMYYYTDSLEQVWAKYTLQMP